MFSTSFKSNYIFCSCFGLFGLVELQQTMGPPSLMPIFVCNASLPSSCMFLLSHCHFKSYFLKNKVIFIKFFRSEKMALVIRHYFWLFLFLLCSLHVQHLSHWRSCIVGGGPWTLCLFVKCATCLKRLRTPN